MSALTPGQRAALRALSHPIKPTVWIGTAGLSEAVIHELDQALKSRELIKIKVSNDDRETREALLEQICRQLEAAPVRHIGRTLVIYRPFPDEIMGDNVRKATEATPEGKKRRPAASPKNKDSSGQGRRNIRTARS
jgi:RNA-binding protein